MQLHPQPRLRPRSAALGSAPAPAGDRVPVARPFFCCVANCACFAVPTLCLGGDLSDPGMRAAVLIGWSIAGAWLL